MQQTIIHIGYPKTGTSWFTDFFYPEIKNAQVSYNDNIFYNFEKGSEFFEVRTKTDEKYKHIIIAHKLTGLVDFVWNNGIYRDFFIKHLKIKYPDACIVIFLRNQVEFLSSAYSSYLTHGGTYTFRNLFHRNRLGDGTMFGFEYLNYYEMIRLYKSHFTNVKVYIYEDFMDDNIKFLHNYKNDFGFDVEVEKLKLVKYNEKLRSGFASFIRFTNILKKRGVKPKKNYINIPWLFYWMTKDRLIRYNYFRFWGKKLSKEKVLGPELIKYIKEYYRESNRLLISEYGHKSIEKYKYPL